MNTLFSNYLDKIIKQSKTVDSRGVMQVNRMIDLELDDIFIELNLKLNNDRTATEQNIKTLNFDDLSLIWQGDPDDVSSAIRTLEKTFVRGGSTDLFGSTPHEIIKLNDVWNKDFRWVLLGDPGAGKTTVLKYLALTHAKKCKQSENDCLVPLPVILRNFNYEFDQNSHWKDSDAILSFLCGPVLKEMGFETSARNELRTVFEKALKNGKAVLLLDGLDEQRNTAAKQKTSDAIEALLNRFPNNRCIVTSRIIGYDLAPLGSGFRSASLEPFNDVQMKSFFDKWFYAIESSEDIVKDKLTENRAIRKAAELLDQLSSNERVRSLAANPLLCSIVGLIFRQGGSTLPAQRAELYKLCIDTFIFNWEYNKTRKGMERVSLDKDETQAALEAIALYLHEKTTNNTASRATLIEVVSSFLKDELGYEQSQARSKSEKLLDLVRDVAGLLIERGNDAYAFFHLTFQEYLAARAITRKRRLIDHYLGSYLFNPRWREVIRLAAIHQGMKDEESGSDFIEAILRHPHQRENEMLYAFRIALQCATEARLELDTSDLLMKRLIDLYLHKPELVDFIHFISSKNLRYKTGTLLPLLSSLRDKDMEVRSTAATALGVFKVQEAVAPLIEALRDDSEFVRSSAADSLGEIKAQEAVEPLIKALRDENEVVRWSATYALKEIKAYEAVVPLIEALQDNSEDVRSFVADALGELKVQEAVAPLIKALRGENEFVRWSISNALGEIKSQETVSLLIEALQDEDELVRSSAADALGEMKAQEAVVQLIAALRDKNEFVRSSAATALGEIKPLEVVALLIDALQDEDKLVRSSAADALGEMKAQEAVALLIATLRDENEVVRSSSARTLGKMKAKEALEPLIEILQDESELVRRWATTALGEMKAQETVAPLIEALRDDSEHVRRWAANALGKIKAQEAVSPLIEVLRDVSKDVRSSVADALGELKAQEAVAPLIEALLDENEDVRSSAANALGEMRAQEAVAPLIEALLDEHELVCRRAAKALGAIKSQRAVASLIEALRNESVSVRRWAAHALGEIKSQVAVTALIAIKKDKNEKLFIRQAAANAIERIDLGGEQ